MLLCSMTDILEDERDLRETNFCSQEIVVVVSQLGIRVVVPPVITDQLSLQSLSIQPPTCSRHHKATPVTS